MLEKTTRFIMLYDFYQDLLTDKQKQYAELYFQDDLSLGEIAEEFSISRQAVYDNINRAQKILEDYESKLQLLTKYEQRMSILQQMEQLMEQPLDKVLCSEVKEKITQLLRLE